METPLNSLLPEHPFWQFSLRVYALPTVADGLLALQREWGLDINFLLYCCWFADTGYGRLTKTQLQQLLTTTHHWQVRVIAALRRLREQLKTWPQRQMIIKIRQAILAEELLAEQIEQLMMVEVPFFEAPQNRTPQQRLTDACKNLAVYCRSCDILPRPDLIKHLYPLLGGVFTQIPLSQIQQTCQTVLLGDIKPSLKNQQSKLMLD